MLKQRVLTSLWFVALLMSVVWKGGDTGFTVLIAVFGVLAALEFYRMVTHNKAKPLTYFGIIWTTFFIISRNQELAAAFANRFQPNLLLPLLFCSAVVLPIFFLMVRRPKERAFTDWVWTIAGIMYIGWLLSHMVALRELPGGQNWVFFVLIITWISDTVAFFIGRRFGHHKLAPSVSPGKTWEGTVAGICGAAIVSLLFISNAYFRLPLAPWQVIVLAILTSTVGQLGDLVESMLKRTTGVKDAGHMMVGHGGVLDRFDSLIFAVVMVYYYAIWLI